MSSRFPEKLYCDVPKIKSYAFDPELEKLTTDEMFERIPFL